MIEPPTPPSFGETFKYRRRLLDLTQAELAKRAGCARVTIHKIESGDLRPSKQLAELLAQALQIPTAEQAAFMELARGAQLAEERRAPATLNARPLTNLPAPVTSFIGRSEETAEVKRILAGTRLLTLTGAGGAGKTRLCLAVAGEVLDEFPDGAWFVGLALLADPAFVPNTVASALNVPEQPGRPLIATLLDYLGDKHLLLILDNCEHLIEACARLADVLLHAAPLLKILATSREALGISGEVAWSVPPLAVPKHGKSESHAQLIQSEAVHLFAERATSIQRHFQVTESNAPVIAQICRRLDGMPLAIELAATRVKALSVEQIAARLDDRFHLLTGGSRTAIPRQQTLRGAIDWSYESLTEPEQRLLRRLSVFAGGWGLEAAEEVAKDDPSATPAEGLGGRMKDEPVPPSSPFVPPQTGFILHPSDVLDLLTRLVEKSLVVA